MAYTKLNAYDARTIIPEFKGLLQYGDNINDDVRYSPEEYNMETQGGVLQPAALCFVLPPQLEYPIETLARLYRRWHSGADKEILIAASHGKLYWMLPSAEQWTELAMPEGVTAFQSNVWSWVSYEINPTGSTAPVDVLLLSNAKDGMFMVRGDNLAVSYVQTPKNFGVITRYAERIWGGAITDDPDMLVYSAPYDPTDWQANPEIPEDGAGDVQQPSWDGDSFTALKQFGTQLIAFKRTRVWRILGTDPGEYAFKEQYGGGAPYENTIAVDSERIFMLSDHGVVYYDGLAVNPFSQEVCLNVWRSMNIPYLSQSAAILWQKKYYVAFPTGDSQINNTVLIYDTVDSTWLMRTDVYVESWLGTETELYFTSSTTPGRIWKWQEDSWNTGECTTAATKWVSPWFDFSRKDIVKGSHELYFLMEVQNEPATIKVSIQSEKKTKTKTYTLKPLTDKQKANDVGMKQKRLHFGGSGRRFRVIIESDSGQPVWRLVSGMMIISEIDPD